LLDGAFGAAVAAASVDALRFPSGALLLRPSELLSDVAQAAPLRELSLILRRQGSRALQVCGLQRDLELTSQRIFREISLRRQAPIERVRLTRADEVAGPLQQVPEHHGGHRRIRVVRV